jgi:hypothetical protein
MMSSKPGGQPATWLQELAITNGLEAARSFTFEKETNNRKFRQQNTH